MPKQKNLSRLGDFVVIKACSPMISPAYYWLSDDSDSASATSNTPELPRKKCISESLLLSDLDSFRQRESQGLKITDIRSPNNSIEVLIDN